MMPYLYPWRWSMTMSHRQILILTSKADVSYLQPSRLMLVPW